jgi:hypothetical protein
VERKARKRGSSIIALLAVIAASPAPSASAKADYAGFGSSDFESAPSFGITDASWAE